MPCPPKWPGDTLNDFGETERNTDNESHCALCLVARAWIRWWGRRDECNLPHKRPEVSKETVRASRFELVDSEGKTLSYWGNSVERLDRNREYPPLPNFEIGFLDEHGRLRAEFGMETAAFDRAAKVAVFSPFFKLNGSEGNIRLGELLDRKQSAVLTMGDAQTNHRLMLGHWSTQDIVGPNEPDPWDKWSLVMRDPSHGWRDYLDIGTATSSMGKRQRTGYVHLRNSADQEVMELPDEKKSRRRP